MNGGSTSSHTELKAMLTEIAGLTARIGALGKELKSSPLQKELKALKQKKKELTAKCEEYMTVNRLNSVRTTTPVVPEVPVTPNVRPDPKPIKTYASIVAKQPRSFTAEDLEQLLPGYFRSRGIKDDTEYLINYLETNVEAKSKLLVRCRAIKNSTSHQPEDVW